MCNVSSRPLATALLLASFALTPSEADAQRGRSRQKDPAPIADQASVSAVTPSPNSLLSPLSFRSIGPAGMSGRVAAIDAVLPDGSTSASAKSPRTIYVGAATGGVWKSTYGGTTVSPIFDEQTVAAIGAIAILQSSPDTVWVGTGEGNPRNSVSFGKGLFRTTDGGASWERKGLEKTERIHRVILHPTDPATLWVCAMGEAWGENPERGVFRTRDAGETWEHVLAVNERTGCADLVADPGNPGTLLAAMWQFRRFPHFFRSGGPSSGLYRTSDGGDTWTRASELDGLPKGDLGRIGLAFAPSDGTVAYALVEAQQNVLLRSDDGGRRWRTVNSSTGVSPRPFYFADIRVDPERPDRVYRLASSLDVSDDGGRSFRTLAGFVDLHPDHHELWIHPHNAEYLLSGNDGGVGISRDRGASWNFVRNLPLAQYYHVRVDEEQPYNVYGGLQDNGSWKGPGSVWEAGFGGGIRNFHWTMVAFGDGFDTAPDPDNPNRGYAMSQGGNLSRWNLSQGGGKAIRPDGPDDEELRFNWNAGFAQDPFESGTIYYGSQYLHRSTDRGESWQRISGDLTTDNEEWQLQKESGGLTLDVTAAENFTTIISVAPATDERGVLWVGTDDGRVHVGRPSDASEAVGGYAWTSVEEKAWAAGVPENTWVPHITPSRFVAGEAFVVFDNHRRSDLKPYVFRVSDYGASWTPLVDWESAQAERMGYALKVEQDPVEEDLLFLGAEFGLWVSFDGGGEWVHWTHGVPTVSVMDMAIQERESDLVLGTHGRGIFVLDDLSPLRALAASGDWRAVLAEPVRLFGVSAAQQYQPNASPGELMPGSTEYRGQNQPYGVPVDFVLNAEGLPHPDEDVRRAEIEAKRLEREARAEWAVYGEGEGAQSGGGMGGGAPGRGRGGRGGGRGGFGGGAGGPQATLEIYALASSPVGEEGEVLRELKVPVHQGLNRTVWNLRTESFKRPGRDEFAAFFGGGGPEVVPGEYGVRVKYAAAGAGGAGERGEAAVEGEDASEDGEASDVSESGDAADAKPEPLTAEGTVTVVADPRLDISQEDRIANWNAVQEAGALQERLAEVVQRIGQEREDLEYEGKMEARAKAEAAESDSEDGADESDDSEESTEGAAEGEGASAGKARAARLKALGELEKKVWTPPGSKGIVSRTSALNQVGMALRSLSSSWDAPNPTHLTMLRQATELVEELEAELERVLAGEAEGDGAGGVGDGEDSRQGEDAA